MIRWLLSVLASRGEMPDPVDTNYLTAAAALAPDSLPDCTREDCAWFDAEFARIVADFYAEEI